MIVTLTGYMGSGKSTVGRKLSTLLDCEFVDLDKYIEKKTGQTIPQIFAAQGEVSFRAIEAEALRDVVIMHQITGSDVVISLGGGTIMTGCLQPLIFEQTISVYLEVSEEVLKVRVGNGHGRPLVDENFSKRLADRIPTYQKAEYCIKADEKDPQAIADEIFDELKIREHNE